MEDNEAQRFRELLKKRHAELVAEGDVELHPEGSRDDPVHKPDEDAAPLAEMNQVIASNRNRTRAQQLERIREALERLAEDPEEFGTCEDCGEDIPRRRLELMPWATLCIPCQEALDNDPTAAGGRRKHLTDYK